MKITKQGTVPSYVWTGTCPHCQCIIEAEEKEVQHSSESRPGEDYGFVMCPMKTCGMQIYVSKTRNYGAKS